MASSIWTALTLFAQGGGGGGGGGPSFLNQFLFMIVPIIFLFYFLMIRPQQKEKSKREAMLQAIKKNDRVITAGGIHGVVTNVHREADEVTIKVDEATNTKLRMTMGSVVRVLGDESPEDSASK